MARARRRDEAIRITTAAESHEHDISVRQRHYLFSMSIRVLCFIGAVVAGVNGINWLWPLLIVGAIVLPYVAVVGANAAHTKGEEFELPDTTYRRELPERPTDGRQDPS
ncbi:Protein of unknown function [Nocardioides terrae]|uniref:DUF3099 domain-containing protein n=1 Tax=Nocardioides terrae TaxID=574651 RepID=A0A1I1JPT8_9ACTN|nr:DUF3099 domain-containing protein [Nocardioides terrae]SFC50657.1 Protein of unknown function [Nocardioides terrae]